MKIGSLHVKNELDELVARQKRGEPAGVASICSAHPWVLKTAMRHTAELADPVLIEATCNQVNQFGGYTGMQPADFVTFVQRIAQEQDFPPDRLLLGGDHLGPSPWQAEPAGTAMDKSAALVAAYTRAGFAKLHLDASMPLGGDPPGPLATETSARRTALLAQIAERAWEAGGPTALRYVIGTEVPVPGGALEHENEIEVTPVERAQETIELTRRAFYSLGLEQAWERVVALVVQPGVEFGDDFVLDYRPERAQGLKQFIEKVPGLVFEAHSTDYQTPQSLQQLKRDHFAILKVGPGLTFAFREAVYALAMMENELYAPTDRSNLIEILDNEMVASPEHWIRYYTGDADTRRFKRRFSFSDRSRYYWSNPQIEAALRRLIANLRRRPPPLSLISQHDPAFYAQLRAGLVLNQPGELIQQRILRVLSAYSDG